MIQSFKKFFLYFFSKSKLTNPELELCYSELKKLQEEQVALTLLCKDILMVRLKQLDKVSKDTLIFNKQVNRLFAVSDQHADSINALIDNYKKHITNPYAHEHNDNEPKEGKKSRNDN